jgi:hypothetical protein
MIMPRTKIVESSWDYLLEKDGDGKIYFEVVCGTVAIYTICFQLTNEEINQWQQLGETFLRHLSYDVRDHPKTYIERRNRESLL